MPGIMRADELLNTIAWDASPASQESRGKRNFIHYWPLLWWAETLIIEAARILRLHFQLARCHSGIMRFLAITPLLRYAPPNTRLATMAQSNTSSSTPYFLFKFPMHASKNAWLMKYLCVKIKIAWLSYYLRASWLYSLLPQVKALRSMRIFCAAGPAALHIAAREHEAQIPFIN